MNEETGDRLNISLTKWPISVDSRSKAGVCGRSLAEIVGSNPTGSHGCLSVVSVGVFSGGRLCVGPSPRPEESNRLNPYHTNVENRVSS